MRKKEIIILHYTIIFVLARQLRMLYTYVDKHTGNQVMSLLITSLLNNDY